MKWFREYERSERLMNLSEYKALDFRISIPVVQTEYYICGFAKYTDDFQTTKHYASRLRMSRLFNSVEHCGSIANALKCDFQSIGHLWYSQSIYGESSVMFAAVRTNICMI